ncbi:hypothetical protein BKA62DRAFT_425389 [Auriculariales sp. MPI-PUGE-AT-0066]|nr:hypothetical protein BKA62DRAFT_425389 [Auriculariales sp. MPI-PUGE-AT-0066]
MTVTFTTTFTDQISKLVSSAIRLQDKMRATYLSFDYQPFSPRVGEYDRNVVEPSDKISHWTDKMHLSAQWAEHGFKHGDMMEAVLAQTALGLRASKSVAKSQGTGMDRQYKVVVRAKAIVGRFTFVKIAQASSSAAPPANHE